MPRVGLKGPEKLVSKGFTKIQDKLKLIEIKKCLETLYPKS